AGERAYRLARAGAEVELAARQVTVSRFAILAIERDVTTVDVAVEVSCSSGTYVRALARNLGSALGVGGHLTALRRTRVGPFTIDGARTLEQLAEAEHPITLLLPDAVRAAMPVRAISDHEARELSFGRAIAAGGIDGTYGA